MFIYVQLKTYKLHSKLWHHWYTLILIIKLSGAIVRTDLKETQTQVLLLINIIEQFYNVSKFESESRGVRRPQMDNRRNRYSGKCSSNLSDNVIPLFCNLSDTAKRHILRIKRYLVLICQSFLVICVLAKLEYSVLRLNIMIRWKNCANSSNLFCV